MMGVRHILDTHVYFVLGFLYVMETTETILLPYIFRHTQTNKPFTVLIPDPPLNSKVFNKAGDLVNANIRHNDHMRYVALARELPLAHERLVARPLEHHRDA
jgi:hypothetical protein